ALQDEGVMVLVDGQSLSPTDGAVVDAATKPAGRRPRAVAAAKTVDAKDDTGTGSQAAEGDATGEALDGVADPDDATVAEEREEDEVVVVDEHDEAAPSTDLV